METIVKKIIQPVLPKMKNELTKICNELAHNQVQLLCSLNKANQKQQLTVDK